MPELPRNSLKRNSHSRASYITAMGTMWKLAHGFSHENSSTAMGLIF